MKTVSLGFLAVLAASLTGCASVKMHDTRLVETARTDKVLVSFVRPAIFMGDGISVDIWDGPTFIGSLGAGNILQHETAPGKHVFMINAENWAYASGDLVAGKQYFLKANIYPGVISGRAALGVVKPDDTRVPEWQRKLKPVEAYAEDRQGVEQKKGAEVAKLVADFNAGQVTSFSQIQAGDGR